MTVHASYFQFFFPENSPIENQIKQIKCISAVSDSQARLIIFSF